MKKRGFLISLMAVILTMAILLVNCSKEQVAQNRTSKVIDAHPFEKIPQDVTGMMMGGILVPEHTKASYISSREVEFIFPEGYQLKQIDWAHDLITTHESRTYTCSCRGDGCDVIWIPGGLAGCSECDKDCTGKWKDGGSEQKLGAGTSDLMNREVTQLFFQVKEDRMQRGKIRSDLGVVPDEFFEIPEVLTKYLSYMKLNYGIEEINEEAASQLDSYENVNLFGYNLVIRIPANDSHSRSMAESPTCNCGSGSSGCTLKKIRQFGVVVAYQCTAGSCTTCEMTIPEQ